ncbi:hypothetical protein [Sporolituus thermophilus]|uniref:Coat F domain-containing protein n=1 Tax=Sporolituus thermophilus DSM 23256 TaxID=1123285 RepID=A0A1G7M5X7_9FIRM|nr:hypothetical protein [Sporolituus thermophilus]SDF57152.1 hypothetical protein SAMN05660235_02029 [Sporolituus thermophilus DSM 23256]
MSATLSIKEKSYLEDAMELENLCLVKYSVYADQCEDTELKQLMFDITKNKRQRADRMKRLLGQTHATHYQ